MSSDGPLADAGAEPPIVARCVVEVRSDGSLSIARGVFELENEQVMLEGVGRSPSELLSMLARGAFAHARTKLKNVIEHKLLGS
jgi:hypothetical protein